jgi:nitrogen fixation protein NifX
MVYQVSATEARLIGIRDTTQAGLVEDDKNRFRAELIRDCQVLYLVSVGGPAAAKIIKLSIHPIKLANVMSLDDVLTELQSVLAGAPPPWLAKVMGLTEEQRVRFAREEDEAEAVND